EAFLDGELHQAADAVATHLGFGAVGVPHPHAHVGDRGLEADDEPVGTDAEMAVADFSGQLLPVVPLPVGERIDVVVAGAVHLGYAHGESVALNPGTFQWY